MRFIFTLATLVAAMLGSSIARAADWSEEFTGGFSNSWIFADDVGNIPPDATAIGIHPNNFLEMNTNANPPDLFVAGFVPANIFADVAATASVAGGRGLLSNNDIFLTVRSNGSSGYLLNLNYASGAVDLVRVDSGAIVGLGAGSSGLVPGFRRKARTRCKCPPSAACSSARSAIKAALSRRSSTPRIALTQAA